VAIKSWRHKGLKKFFETGDASMVQTKHIKILRILLFQLDHVSCAKEMDTPGNNFHCLSGKLQGYYSVKVNVNWRLIFKFDKEDAILVNYLDYH
jgi:proteic killer suppression protein